MSTGERFLCILSFSHQEGKDFFVMHAVVSCQQVKDFYAFCRFHIKREKIFLVMHAVVSCQQVKVFFYNALSCFHVPSFRAAWLCQLRAFSHASGVYHLDGGFFSLVSG